MMADVPQRRLYRISIPIPNKALGEWLNGPRAREIVESRAAELFSVYEAMLPVRTERLGRFPPPGHLKRSAYYRIGRGGWDQGGDFHADRWFGWVGNTAWYASTIEWGSPKRNIEGQHTLARAAATLWGHQAFHTPRQTGDLATVLAKRSKALKLKQPKTSRKLTPGERRAKQREDASFRKAMKDARKAEREAQKNERDEKRAKNAKAREKSKGGKNVATDNLSARKIFANIADTEVKDVAPVSEGFDNEELFEGVRISDIERLSAADAAGSQLSRAERQLLKRYFDD